MKKLIITAAMAVISAGLLFAEPKEFKSTSVKDTVIDMKTGWNLGNTMDAIGTGLAAETSWTQPKTTKAMIDTLAASGMKTIRIPVTWSKHMNRKTYAIDSAWMNRVKEIVNWAIDDGLYVILNSHHDNAGTPDELKEMGYYPNSLNYEKSAEYLRQIWTQIGNAFIDYDEHLIFETMNEPRACGTNYEWWYDGNSSQCKDNAATLNKLNQVALDTIRATGGNNQKRYVMIPGLRASPSSVLDKSFIIPKDDEPGKLIISVHMYDPYDFAMNTPGTKTFTERHKSELKSTFNRLNAMYVSQGIPVVIGEYGATNKGNTEDRIAWFDYFLTEAKKIGSCAVLWDNGSASPNPNEGEHFGYFNRRALTWYDNAIIEKINEVFDRKSE